MTSKFIFLTHCNSGPFLFYPLASKALSTHREVSRVLRAPGKLQTLWNKLAVVKSDASRVRDPYLNYMLPVYSYLGLEMEGKPKLSFFMCMVTTIAPSS